MEISLLKNELPILFAKPIFMNFNDVIILLLEALDLSQALSIGLFLSLVYRRKKSNLLYLGIFLMVIGLSSFLSIIEQLFTFSAHTELTSLPFNLFLLIPCFLYLYVQKASVLKENKKDYLIFLPGILDVLFGIAVLCFPHYLQGVQDSFYYEFFQILGLIYFPIIVILILLKIRKNSKLLKEQYSSVEDRELKWVGTMVVLILTYLTVFPGIMYYASEFVGILIDSLFWLFVTFWSAYNGLLQQSSKNLIMASTNTTDETIVQASESTPITSTTKPLVKISSDSEKHQEIFSKLEQLIKEEELYLNAELTISDLAQRIHEHPRLISTTINVISGNNFNSYINLFRVEKAKSLLLSGRSKTINIESVGQESGFKSNSSFYNAFKKNLNVTPLQFLKTNETSQAS